MHICQHVSILTRTCMHLTTRECNSHTQDLYTEPRQPHSLCFLSLPLLLPPNVIKGDSMFVHPGGVRMCSCPYFSSLVFASACLLPCLHLSVCLPSILPQNTSLPAPELEIALANLLNFGHQCDTSRPAKGFIYV